MVMSVLKVTGSLKRRRETIQDEVTMELSDYHHPEATETSVVSDDGRINEIDFIGCVRSMAKILYAREKKKMKAPIYDRMLYRRS